MDSTIKCDSCGRVKPETDFSSDNKRTCAACKLRKHEKTVSKSHEAFLRSLCSKSKSAVNAGKRPDHIEFLIGPKDLIALWDKQNGRCAVSGVVLTHHKDGFGTKDFNASLDRISNDRSYTPDNIQLVCYRVNLMKHALTEDMFYWWVRTIHDFSCK